MHRLQECGRNPERSATARLSGPGYLPREIPLDSARPDRSDGEAPVILVVEDDRAVRHLFSRVLESAGFSVIACENGPAALAAARPRLNEIRAVVTDAKMPGMSGQKLLSRLRTLRPVLPAIVVSGNPIDGIADATTVFLVKPVTPGRLTEELQRLLCGRM
jgi:two-component system chemotaxis response regulator CheY